MSFEDTKSREKHYSYRNYKKIEESLWNVGSITLADRIKSCARRIPDGTTNQIKRSIKNEQQGKSGYQGVCRSPWCLGCREFLYYQYWKKVNNRISSGKIKLEDHTLLYPLPGVDDLEKKFVNTQYTNKDLKHITGIVGLCGVREDLLQNLIEDDTKRWRKIRRNLNKIKDEVVWIESVYELELVDWRKLKNSNGSDEKKRQMFHLIENEEFRRLNSDYVNQPFLFVHWHGLTNLSHEQMKKVFKQYYWIDGDRVPKTNPDTGLYVQNLHKNKTLEENIRKICSYPFKNPFRYKHSYIGSDYLNGEFFTPFELGNLIKVYDKFIGRQGRTLFRSLNNDAEYWWGLREKIMEVLTSKKLRHPAYTELVGDITYALRSKKYNTEKNQSKRGVGLEVLKKLDRYGGSNVLKDVSKFLSNREIYRGIKENNKLYWKFQPLKLNWYEQQIENYFAEKRGDDFEPHLLTKEEVAELNTLESHFWDDDVWRFRKLLGYRDEKINSTTKERYRKYPF